MMSTTVEHTHRREALYRGLRMTADEYFRLEDDGFRYELIDGIVCMSPSPTPTHQHVATQIKLLIAKYLDQHPVGVVLGEVDVYLESGRERGDLVYRPDIVFLRTDRMLRNRERIVEPPDLVVEIISNSSRRYDLETKKSDYERCGVREYWVIDPDRNTMTFYRLDSGRYVEVAPEGSSLTSQAVPGFVLDLDRVRRAFEEL